MEAQNKIVFPAPGDLKLRLTTEVFANATGTAAGAAITSYECYVTEDPVVVPTSVVNTSQTVNTIDLYINNIFVNPEINIICL